MEERIKIYMGDAYDRSFTVDLSHLSGMNKPYTYCFNDFKNTAFPLNKTSYYHDMSRFIYPFPEFYQTKFLFYPHDRVEPFSVPTLVKSRPVSGNDKSILFNMNFHRHFHYVFDIEKNDIAYSDKKSVLIWRGGCTGYGFGNHIPYRAVSRQNLVEMFASHSSPIIDIGLARINRQKYKDFTAYEKPSLTLKEQLEYKFILSIEGNDVATNLKWILYSNSVPFCPPFAIQSWILEDRLIPYTHYIPVRSDFLDLEDKVDWALHHPRVCNEIIQNGKEYMKPFLDLEQEENLRKEIFFRYTKNIKLQ